MSSATTNTTVPTTRPARPGDVLARAEVGGVSWVIYLDDPPAHPASGVPAERPALVRLRGELRIPTSDGFCLHPAYISPEIVLGSELYIHWGYSATKWRYRSVTRDGDAIAPVLQALILEMNAAAQAAEAVADRHRRSVAALDAARQAAYAAWPVAEVAGG